MSDLTRPIIGIENRTAQEVFDIMCDRFRRVPSPSPAPGAVEAQIAWTALEKIVKRADPTRLFPIAYEAAKAAAKIAEDALHCRGEIRDVDFPGELFPVTSLSQPAKGEQEGGEA